MRLYCLLLLVLSACLATPAAAENRVALVIGNNAYTGLSGLDNPGVDANRLAQTLKSRGFDVISCDGQRPGCFDVTRAGLQSAIAQLKAKSAGAGLAFVFYAGHGMESGGDNLLAPVDATIDCKTHQLSQGVLLGELLELLEGAKQKIIVLDACRDNPLGEVCPPLATPRSLSFRDFKIPDAGNFLLFSSTKPGQVALDGPAGQHSPFAAALFRAFDATPNVHFHQVFDRVAKAVIETTTKADAQGKPQVPEMLVRGGAPESCLAGENCAADRQAAALREEVETLRREHARDQELGETARVTLTQIEAARGKALSEQERRRILEELKDAGRALVARNDDRGERALDRLKEGDTGEAERLFQEDMEAREAEAKAEMERAAEKRRKAADAARHLAALARAKNVAKAADYYRRATELDPEDLLTWENYAETAREAGRTLEAKNAFEQQAQKARAQGNNEREFWAAVGQGEVAKDRGALTEALQAYRTARAAAERLANASPDNPEGQRLLSVASTYSADILEGQGNLPEALKAYNDALAIFDRLSKADPENNRRKRDSVRGP